MDRAQFGNWYDFSDRMARQARPGLSGPTKSRLVRVVGKAIREAVERHGLDAFEDWDSPPYPGDLFEAILEREGMLRRDPRTGEVSGEMGSLALCCLKAGFDVSVAPSDGVAGADFTVDLIRRMYPSGTPGFVETHLAQAGVDVIRDEPGRRVWL